MGHSRTESLLLTASIEHSIQNYLLMLVNSYNMVLAHQKNNALACFGCCIDEKNVTFLKHDQIGSYSCLHVTMHGIIRAQKLGVTNRSNFAEHQEWQFHELKSLRDQPIVTENGNMKQVNCMSGSRRYLWRILDDFHP